MESAAKRVAQYGLFLALALAAAYLENLLPLSFTVPGVKLGLANAIVMVILYKKGLKSAIIVSFARIILASALFSGMFTMIYSIAGAFLSISVMAVLNKTGRFGVVGVSTAGGICHNIGQLIVASIVVENHAMFYYFPVLCVSGVICGTIIGMLTGMLIERLKFC